MVVTGDNVGNVILLNMDGREVRSRSPVLPTLPLSLPPPEPLFSAALESEIAQKESDPCGPEPML